MKLKFFLLLLTFLIVNSSLLIGTVRYVSKTGTSQFPYTSWQTAADSIQKCINICIDGDTIYVANGVYKETLVINIAISLIGSSMDSTVIDGTGLSGSGLDSLITIDFLANGIIENFNIKGKGINSEFSTAIVTTNDNISVKNCRISNAETGFLTFYTSSIVKRVIFTNINKAVRSACFPDTCNVVIDSCIIITNDTGESIIHCTYGSPAITNNMIIEEGTTPQGTTWLGIYLDASTRRALINNNNIAGYYSNDISISGVSDSAFILNNNILYTLRPGSSSGAIMTLGGYRTQIRNNIIGYSYRGLNCDSEPTNSDYNLFWENAINTSGYAILHDSDIVADPMFVKDTIPSSDFTFDFHLQKYSPAIDKGDPEILDKDKTRSDIGMYGGPLGDIYTYQDLAPLAPRNLSAVVDSNQILVKWNKNTEADTLFYKAYRDTVVNFTIDSTKLVSSSPDTFFVQPNPHINTRYVYKVTCVDNQDNESLPSEEVVVDLTSVSIDDYPMTISDYCLYQNYPNPFNPSTKIGYQLKERAYVKLMVYDIKGELISVLVNKEQNAGYYEIEFSSSSIQHPESSIKGLASGIYLYRIEVIGEERIPVYTDMKKMILIK